MRAQFVFAWYDIWAGAYWDRERQALYILPIPMVGVRLAFGLETKFKQPQEKRTQRSRNFVRRYSFVQGDVTDNIALWVRRGRKPIYLVCHVDGEVIGNHDAFRTAAQQYQTWLRSE